MINRGVSGELATQAAARIKNEVALTRAGPGALAGRHQRRAGLCPDRGSRRRRWSIRCTWLKEHKIDIVLVGLQYIDRMEQDEHYRKVRDMLRTMAAKENVMIVRRYEAQRLLSQAAGAAAGFSRRVPAHRGRLHLPRAIHGARDHARHLRPRWTGPTQRAAGDRAAAATAAVCPANAHVSCI